VHNHSGTQKSSAQFWAVFVGVDALF